MNKNLVLFVFICLVGCTKYNIPIQTKNHPASSKTASLEIELSSVLDIEEDNNKEDNKGVFL